MRRGEGEKAALKALVEGVKRKSVQTGRPATETRTSSGRTIPRHKLIRDDEGLAVAARRLEAVVCL
jgi:hypothetical protein